MSIPPVLFIFVVGTIACTPAPGGFNIHNADPRAEITSHADGDSPEAGYRTFTGTAEDPDHQVEDLELTWLYDGSEACPPVSPDDNGNTSCEIFLESGDRTVTLQVNDPMGGLGSDKVTLDVQPYGDPWAEITAPLAGDVYYSDQLVDLTGEVGDEADDPSDLEVWWESSLDGDLNVNVEPDASGNVVGSEYLSQGEHQLQLRVRNSGGNEAYDTVTIEVGAPNTAPTCSIDAPESGAEYEYGDLVTFEASVGDVDVPGDWLTATWSSHLQGELGSTVPSTAGETAFPISDLEVGSHNVTLTVADEQGLTCTDYVIVTINDCPTIWHADDDGDGFGDPDSTATGCEAPSGYVDSDSDCDDTDPAGNPAAPEVCDDLDDDCDGDIDDDDSGLDTSTASTWYADDDGDGYGDAADTTVTCDQPSGHLSDDTDCDDNDATAYPGAAELCDGVDNDCDSRVDEHDAIDASTWYADADGDGFGDSGSTTAACSVPSDYTSDATDCDDGDATINPDAAESCDSVDNDCDGTVDEDDASDASTWYADADGDGYGDATSTTAACSVPSGYLADDTDCDDTRSSVNPDEDELCNGRDDDCDGDTDEDSAVDASTWYQDRDADGYGDDATTTMACNHPSGYAAYGGDCDDGDAAYNPGASETDCADPSDYNCDGVIVFADDDGDGFAACEECDDTDATVNPDASELCDGVDNDCDGDTDEDDATDASTWYADTDADGYGDAASTDVACAVPSGYVSDATDCDDSDASSHPSADEYCDGADNDCDGTVDEDDAVDATTWYSDGDGDGYGDAAATRTACVAPSGFGVDDSDCDDSDSSVNPGADEYCDSVDNDCDGTTDEDDAVDATTWHLDSDSDGYGGTLYDVVACAQPSGFVADSTDCLDSSASVYPGASESCNGIDDDCDGTIDEDEAVDVRTWYVDGDGDGYGSTSGQDFSCEQPTGYVADATDCDDASAVHNPGVDEVCDGDDNDCDGDVDEDSSVDASTWFADDDGDSYGDASSTRTACDQPSGYTAGDEDCDDSDSSRYPGADEYCNGFDDDCDGDTDEDDAVDVAFWYFDYDGDGYGTLSYMREQCDQPAGYADNADDCDDLDALINPGITPDDCSGVDEDCDGFADEDCCPTAMLPIPTSSSSFPSGWFCIDDVLRSAGSPSSASTECSSLSDLTASVCTVSLIQEAYDEGYDWGQEWIGTTEGSGCCCPCSSSSDPSVTMWDESSGSRCECWDSAHVQEFLCCGEP